MLFEPRLRHPCFVKGCISYFLSCQ